MGSFRRRWLAGCVAALIAGGLAATAFAQDSAPGTVGGPPTRAPATVAGNDVLVIGTGTSIAGRVEVLAVDRGGRLDLCAGPDYLDTRFRLAACNHDVPVFPGSIEVSPPATFGPKPKPRFTAVHGELSPEVVSVQIRIRRPGGIRIEDALVSQVGVDLAARLGQDEPFGHFVATVPRKVPRKRVAAVALDGQGNVLDSDRPGPRP